METLTREQVRELAKLSKDDCIKTLYDGLYYGIYNELSPSAEFLTMEFIEAVSKSTGPLLPAALDRIYMLIQSLNRLMDNPQANEIVLQPLFDSASKILKQMGESMLTSVSMHYESNVNSALLFFGTVNKENFDLVTKQMMLVSEGINSFNEKHPDFVQKMITTLPFTTEELAEKSRTMEGSLEVMMEAFKNNSDRGLFVELMSAIGL